MAEMQSYQAGAEGMPNVAGGPMSATGRRAQNCLNCGAPVPCRTGARINVSLSMECGEDRLERTVQGNVYFCEACLGLAFDLVNRPFKFFTDADKSQQG